MGSTLNGYFIAKTGMYVSQASLSVVSHNLSNVNTDGYSRQQVSSAEQTVRISAETSYGSGVNVQSIARARDTFFDQTYRQQNSKSEYWNGKNSFLEDAQKLLNEFNSNSNTSTTSSNTSNGLETTIQDFFDSWEQLTKEPDSQSTRSGVVESAVSLVDTFQQINEQLLEMQQDARSRVQDGVDSVNDLAKQVADLNRQITKNEVAGTEASDLRDTRDKLLDKISSQVNATVTEQSNGTLDVSIGGVSLIKGDQVHTLETVETGSVITVQWAELGEQAKITDGSLKAYLEEADQSSFGEISPSSTYNFTTDSVSSLSDLRQGLNDLMTTMTNQVNSLLESGKDLEGNAGTALFVKVDQNKPYELGNIQVNSDITSDIDKIAAGTSGSSGDSTIASAICDLTSEENYSFQNLSVNQTSFYQSLISWLSTTGDTASSNYDTQSALMEQAKNQRSSVSSVSQDEELSKMIVYQNAYNASAKVLSTIDSLIGELIDSVSG